MWKHTKDYRNFVELIGKDLNLIDMLNGKYCYRLIIEPIGVLELTSLESCSLPIINLKEGMDNHFFLIRCQNSKYEFDVTIQRSLGWTPENPRYYAEVIKFRRSWWGSRDLLEKQFYWVKQRQ